MAPKENTSKEVIAHDFFVFAQGKLEKSKIDAAVDFLLNTTAKKSATGSIMSCVFYLQVTVTSTDDKKDFFGQVGGMSSPGGGALIGDIYSDDFDKLYRKTNTIELNATPVYTSVVFFDSESNVLGSFQAGAVSTVLGIGGGTGSWTPQDTVALTLDNKHGGTYIAHGKLTYDLDGEQIKDTNKASGGLSSSIQISPKATNLNYEVTYTSSKVVNNFQWPAITGNIDIEVRGVWPGAPSARENK